MNQETVPIINGQIMLKLHGLGIKTAQFQRAVFGPVVSTLYYKLGFDVPISRILNKSEDIAIACNAEAVMIFRKGAEIAIEIPNKERKIVSFDTCLYHMMTKEEFNKMTIPIMLGVDTYGNPFNMDLVEQPHILVAGSTGGGKSVLLSSIIGGIACVKEPKEIRLILVDTKKLDLPLFSTMPHVADNIEDVVTFQQSMNKLMGIVRRRTDKMKGIARNITEWNKLNPDSQLPFYVMVIDELADLIDEDKGKRFIDDDYAEAYQPVQQRIKSLIQICRAAGVHIIAATQRSSVKIISGDIKANFPTRIALRLPSRADSSTILSGNGAENLLGKGDMLIESPDFPVFKRAHGAYVSNEDITRILDQAGDIRQQFKIIQGGMA